MTDPNAIRPLMAVAVMVLGFGLLVRAAYSFYDTRQFMMEARSAEGVVLEIVAGHRSRKTNETTYTPMIEFQPVAGGRSVVFKSRVARDADDYAVGEIVPVLFLPDEPENARLGTFLGTRGREILFAILGVLFIVVGRFVLKWR